MAIDIDGEDITIVGNDASRTNGYENDLLYGDEEYDFLSAGLNDILDSGTASDEFEFLVLASTIGEETITIRDFSSEEGDLLDLSDFIFEHTDTDDAISDFIQVSESGGDTVVDVVSTGSADLGAASISVSVEGITGLTNEHFAGNVAIV